MPHHPPCSTVATGRPAAALSWALLVAALCPGCGPTARARRSEDLPGFAARSSILGGEEILASGAGSLLDAIARLRPQFLAASGTPSRPVTLVVDDVVFGTAADLRLLRAEDVARVRYLSATEAVMRFGRGHDAGAIVVTTRRGRRP